MREGPRISYYAAPSIAACAVFFEESRMKFANATKPRQEIRGDGASGGGTMEPFSTAVESRA
jgi:hypothetical protein